MGRAILQEFQQARSSAIDARALVETLCEQVGEIDEASIEGDGSITFRREIFYRHPQGVARFRLAVMKAFRARNIRYVELESGEAWQPFSEARALTGRSFWYVKVKLTAFVSRPNYDRSSKDQ